MSNNSDITDINLPLQNVDNITISNNPLFPNITIPALVNADGGIYANNIGSFHMPDLVSLNNELIITNSAIPILDFPELTSVGSDIQVLNGYSLNDIRLLSLTSIGSPSGTSLSAVAISYLISISHLLHKLVVMSTSLATSRSMIASC